MSFCSKIGTFQITDRLIKMFDHKNMFSDQNITGSNIRRLRKEQNLTQTALIARCQVVGWQLSRETLAKIESGVRRVNDAEVALFVRILKTSYEKVFGDHDNFDLLTVARHSPDVEESERC